MCSGEHPCDKRRNIAEYQKEFPGIDFSQVCVLTVLPAFRRACLELLLPSILRQLLTPPSWLPQIETDEDVMWKPDVRETDAEIAERGYRFLQVRFVMTCEVDTCM